MLSELIERYHDNLPEVEADSSITPRDLDIESLEEIGTELDKVGPTQVTPEDLKQLEGILVKVRLAMKYSKEYKSSEIEVVEDLIAKVATLSEKKVSSRSYSMNREIVSLGDSIINLANMLKSSSIVITISAILEEISRQQ